MKVKEKEKGFGKRNNRTSSKQGICVPKTITYLVVSPKEQKEKEHKTVVMDKVPYVKLPEHILLLQVANTPEQLREYFRQEGREGERKRIEKIIEKMLRKNTLLRDEIIEEIYGDVKE